jgi:hypothetical protein
MHNQFADTFTHIEALLGSRLAFVVPLTDGGGVGGAHRPPSKAPTPTQQVQAATADGTIADDEKTTFAADANKDVLSAEETRLKNALGTTGAIVTTVPATGWFDDPTRTDHG